MDLEELENKVDALDFGVEKSMRYHQRRRGFFDQLHRSAMFGVIVLGSAAFAKVIERPDLLTAIVVLFAAIDLTWSPSQKARDHEILFHKFSDLAIKIRKQSASPEDYATWTEERLVIEKAEPPPYVALEADCHNEVCRAWGRDGTVSIDWWSRLTMNLFRYSDRAYI